MFEEGDLEHGIWSAGISVARVKDIPTCEEMVSRLVADAKNIIDDRLQSVKALTDCSLSSIMFFASATNLDTISSQVGISLTLATEIPADHIPCSRSPSSNTTLPL